MKGGITGDKRLIITKGLLDAMAIAHQDRSDVLFDKIKTVIITMAKETKVAADGEQLSDEEKQGKTILFTEILTKILNPKLDPKVSSVYRAAFFYVIKSLKEDKDFRKLIRSSYKELLRCYLQKRASNTLTQDFFQNAFNTDLEFSYSFFKFLLKCTLPIVKKESTEEKKSEPIGARTLKQRFLAIDLLHFLVKRTRKSNEESLFRKLGDNFALMAQCCTTILEDINNMKHRVKNASNILNLYIDAGMCIKYNTAIRKNYAAEIDRSTEEIIVIVNKLSQQKDLKQLKERVKHLKKLIHL